MPMTSRYNLGNIPGLTYKLSSLRGEGLFRKTHAGVVRANRVGEIQHNPANASNSASVNHGEYNVSKVGTVTGQDTDEKPRQRRKISPRVGTLQCGLFSDHFSRGGCRGNTDQTHPRLIHRTWIEATTVSMASPNR
jgi:hypothetical protein